MQTFEICGYNYNHYICEISNNDVYPPVKSKFNTSSILSYSLEFRKSVVVIADGIVYVIGNFYDRSMLTPNYKTFDNFTKIDIKDCDGQPFTAISAGGGCGYTLYIASKGAANNNNYLLYSHYLINSKYPTILNTKDHNPIALFTGHENCAAISSDGAILHIHESICEFPTRPIEPIYLPDSEIATSIAWDKFHIFVLSSTGRVYSSLTGSILAFNEVTELEGIEIICLSGLHQHCLAVSKDGKVFVRGYNSQGQLGLGKEIHNVTEFTEISSLSNYKIVAAYAGISHSMFQTDDGKLLSCGNNSYGELLISSGPSNNYLYEPILTNVEDVSFCILGTGSTAVFRNYIPPMCPNKRININRINTRR